MSPHDDHIALERETALLKDAVDEVRAHDLWPSDDVLAQYEYIRVVGITNMFDSTVVQRLAFDWGFYELVTWIDECKRAGSSYIGIFNRFGSRINIERDNAPWCSREQRAALEIRRKRMKLENIDHEIKRLQSEARQLREALPLSEDV